MKKINIRTQQTHCHCAAVTGQPIDHIADRQPMGKTRVRSRSNLPYPLLLVFLGLLSLYSCSTSVTVDAPIPTPLVRQIDLSVGVYFPPTLVNFVYEESIPNQGSWRIDMGAQNLAFFRRMFSSMFAQVLEIPAFDLPGGDDIDKKPVVLPDGIDALLVPEILKYGFLTPQISGLDFFSASIHYRLRVYDRDGNLAVNWVVVGYGKSPDSVFNSGKALAEATTLAIRDAGARIAIEARRHPGVVRWLDANNVTLEQDAGDE